MCCAMEMGTTGRAACGAEDGVHVTAQRCLLCTLRIALSLSFSESWEKDSLRLGQRYLHHSFLQSPEYLDHLILPSLSPC